MSQPKDPQALTDDQVIAWLKERHVNTLRIAGTKSGTDREGWLEDALYLEQAVRAIEYYKAGYVRKLDELSELYANITAIATELEGGRTS